MCIRDSNWRLAKNHTYCKASVFCIRYFWNYLYLHSGKRKLSGTFYSRGCRNRLIKSIYLQKCTVHDKLRTVHFFLFNITFSQFFKQEVTVQTPNISFLEKSVLLYLLLQAFHILFQTPETPFYLRFPSEMSHNTSYLL